MKPSRLTEEQIIGILREQEAGAKDSRPGPQTWHEGSHAFMRRRPTGKARISRAMHRLGGWRISGLRYKLGRAICAACVAHALLNSTKVQMRAIVMGS
jgi:hypothetical protein